MLKAKAIEIDKINAFKKEKGLKFIFFKFKLKQIGFLI